MVIATVPRSGSVRSDIAKPGRARRSMLQTSRATCLPAAGRAAAGRDRRDSGQPARPGGSRRCGFLKRHERVGDARTRHHRPCPSSQQVLYLPVSLPVPRGTPVDGKKISCMDMVSFIGKMAVHMLVNTKKGNGRGLVHIILRMVENFVVICLKAVY